MSTAGVVDNRFGDARRAKPLAAVRAPAISVVMSAYNAQAYLAEAVDSILAQTFGDFELLVIDDGSTDRTLPILRDYERRDARLRVISRPNTGLTKALNEGVAAARGEFLARMDADDVALPHRFATQIEFLRANPDVVCVGAAVEMTDPFGIAVGVIRGPLTHDEIDAQLLQGNGGTIVHPASMMRLDVVRHVGAYREQYNNSEDLDLWLRLAEAGRVVNLPDVLLRYRRHYESVTHQKYENQWRMKKQIVADAYARRGQPMPADWSFTPWRPKPPGPQMREWAWRALAQRHLKAARSHAWGALRREPFNLESWRVAYCALRGR